MESWAGPGDNARPLYNVISKPDLIIGVEILKFERARIGSQDEKGVSHYQYMYVHYVTITSLPVYNHESPWFL